YFAERTLKIFDPQRLPADHRMERNAHDARNFRALRIELLELVHHRSEILLAGVAFAHIEPDVIDLHAVRYGEEVAGLHLHRIGLADLRIERDRRLHADRVQHVGDSPQSDAHAVFAPSVIDDVGHPVRRAWRDARPGG